MARVIGTVKGKEVYNKECLTENISKHIALAFDCWGSIDEIREVSVTVIEDDGYKWLPI